MDHNLEFTGLERHGLTVRQVLGLAPQTITLPQDVDTPLSIFMQNDVRRSRKTDPSVPVAAGRMELLRIDVRDNLITLTSINGDSFLKNYGGSMERSGARRYGLKTVPLLGAGVYMLLQVLPDGIVDPAFVPAHGTAVLFDDLNNGPRVLRASGMDLGNDADGGWIFEAIEI